MENDSTNTSLKRLRYDIISSLIKDPHNAKKRLVYGRKGEQVKIIAEHNNTLIVENLQGNRFPVGRIELI